MFDIQTFGGNFYGNSKVLTSDDTSSYKVIGEHNNAPLNPLQFTYKTPLGQVGFATGGDAVTNSEYDFRLNIPRNNPTGINKDWGDRLRGKTMQCRFDSLSNNLDFSLQYITTKFRMSWT